MAEPLRHRQTKEAATDMFSLQPPRYIPTLPVTEMTAAGRGVRYLGRTCRAGHQGRWLFLTLTGPGPGAGLQASDVQLLAPRPTRSPRRRAAVLPSAPRCRALSRFYVDDDRDAGPAAPTDRRFLAFQDTTQIVAGP